MFHACGWTYPWAITFASALQVTLTPISPREHTTADII